MIDLNKYKAIVFDLDGTIIDSMGNVLRSFQYALSPWNIDFTLKEVELVRPRPKGRVFEGFGLTDEQVEIAYSRLLSFTEKHSDEIGTFKGIDNLFKKLSGSHFKKAIWTGRDTDSANFLLKKKNLCHFFDLIVGNSCVDQNKPHPEGLEKISNELSIPTDEFIVVGDHCHDIEAANRVQALGVAALWGGESKDHFLEVAPNYYTAKITELTDLLGL